MISYTEIIFIIIGAMAVVVGFIMPAGRNETDINPEEAKKEVKDMVRSSIDEARTDIHTEIDDTLEESMLSAERSMERITNDKISAISDYAESVLSDIHKNHEEVMFMYDMLNDKQKNLSGIANEAAKKAEEARATAAEAQVAAGNAKAIAHASTRSDKIMRETAQLLRDDAVKREREERLKAEREMLLNKIEETRAEKEQAAAESVAPAQSVATPAQSALASGTTGFTGIGKVMEQNRSSAAAKQAALEAVGFAPLEDAIVRIGPDVSAEHILQSDTVSREEEQSAMAADMVAQALSAKVVTFSEKKHEHDMEVERLLAEQQRQVVNGTPTEVYTYPVMQNKQQTILHMHNEGMSNVTIARELNMGVGEVRLVLDLMGKHRKIRR